MWQNWTKWIWDRTMALSAFCNVLHYINNSWYWTTKNHKQSVHEVITGLTVAAVRLKGSTVQPQCVQLVELHHSKQEIKAAALADTALLIKYTFMCSLLVHIETKGSKSGGLFQHLVSSWLSEVQEGQWCLAPSADKKSSRVHREFIHNCHTEHVYSRWLLRFLIYHTSN